MKSLILPYRELQLLSGQLQNFPRGYSVAEIRMLDKVIKAMDLCLTPFVLEIKNLNIAKYKDNAEKEKTLEEFVETKGKEEVTCSLKDDEFDFIKSLWGIMSGLSGNSMARKAIIGIDDAINRVGSDNAVFSLGKKVNGQS